MVIFKNAGLTPGDYYLFFYTIIEHIFVERLEGLQKFYLFTASGIQLPAGSLSVSKPAFCRKLASFCG